MRRDQTVLQDWRAELIHFVAFGQTDEIVLFKEAEATARLLGLQVESDEVTVTLRRPSVLEEYMCEGRTNVIYFSPSLRRRPKRKF